MGKAKGANSDNGIVRRRIWPWLLTGGSATAAGAVLALIVSYFLLKPGVDYAKTKTDETRDEAVKTKGKAEVLATDVGKLQEKVSKAEGIIDGLLNDPKTKQRVVDLVAQVNNNADNIDGYLTLVRDTPTKLIEKKPVSGKSEFTFKVPKGSGRLRLVLTGVVDKKDSDSDCYIRINSLDDKYTSLCMMARENMADKGGLYHTGRVKGLLAGTVVDYSKNQYIVVDYCLSQVGDIVLGQGQSTYCSVTERPQICVGYYCHGFVSETKPITAVTVLFQHWNTDKKSEFTGEASLYSFPPPP